MDDYLTVSAAWPRLLPYVGSQAKFYRLRKSGKLPPPTIIAGRPFYALAAVNAMIEELAKEVA